MTRIFAKVILDIDLDQKKMSLFFAAIVQLMNFYSSTFNSCGVANVKDFKSEMTHLPKYVQTQKVEQALLRFAKNF